MLADRRRHRQNRTSFPAEHHGAGQLPARRSASHSRATLGLCQRWAKHRHSTRAQHRGTAVPPRAWVPVILPEVILAGPDLLRAPQRKERCSVPFRTSRTPSSDTALPNLLPEHTAGLHPPGPAWSPELAPSPQAHPARPELPHAGPRLEGSSGARPGVPQNGGGAAAPAAPAPRPEPGAAPGPRYLRERPGLGSCGAGGCPAGRGAPAAWCAPRSCALRAVLSTPPSPEPPWPEGWSELLDGPGAALRSEIG